MKNITITLDSDTAEWIRMQAAAKNMSVSRLVGELLRDRRAHSSEYERAMRAYLSKPPYKLQGPAEPLPSRDEIHDRTRFR
jgi:hypothetical protein